MSKDFESGVFTFDKRWLMNFFGHAPKERSVYNHFILVRVLISPGTFVITSGVPIILHPVVYVDLDPDK